MARDSNLGLVWDTHCSESQFSIMLLAAETTPHWIDIEECGHPYKAHAASLPRQFFRKSIILQPPPPTKYESRWKE